jgi:DNA mismatch repair protein MutS2
MPTSNELHLRRKPILEAMHELDTYLNHVFLDNIVTVRIIHGKGSGEMRKAVWEALSIHPLVKNFRIGFLGEGDAGVTVVDMESQNI